MTKTSDDPREAMREILSGLFEDMHLLETRALRTIYYLIPDFEKAFGEQTARELEDLLHSLDFGRARRRYEAEVKKYIVLDKAKINYDIA